MNELDYSVESSKTIEEASALLETKTSEHNFRVLAVHDVRKTLADKGFEISPLKIYEVCNAGFAYKALSKDKRVSMFMPCRIVLRQEKNKTVITLARPSMISKMLPDSGLEELAGNVETELIKLIDEIK
jgi:uncharacterized protein (DUF302 family)